MSAAGTVQQDHVFIGGVVDLDEVATGVLAQSMVATGDIGFYSHYYGIANESPASDVADMASAFAGAGPGEAELNLWPDPSSFFSTTYMALYEHNGLFPTEANVNLTVTDGAAPALITPAQEADWKSYVDVARTYGIETLAPVISPNTDDDDLSSWNAPYWQSAQQAALYGGGLAIDAPPVYFAGRGAAYQAFTEQQIEWAHSVGIRSTVIISPYGGDEGSLLADAQKFVQTLANAGALPDEWVVEDYTYGSTITPQMLVDTAIWLAARFPGTSTASVTGSAGTATTSSATTSPATTSPATMSPATTSSATTSSATTSSATTSSATTSSVTTSSVTTSSITAPFSPSGLVMHTTAGASTSLALGAQATTVTSLGNDTITASSGDATIYAAGSSISVAGGAGALLFVAGAGSATVAGGAGSDILFAGSGPASMTAGSGGHSILVAGSGNATLTGAADGDVLYGGTGQTVLNAGADGEIIVGGAGGSTMVGGAGGSTSIDFIGNAADTIMTSGGGGTIEIVGFRPQVDRLVLPPGVVAAGEQHGSWGTTVVLADRTSVVVFGADV